MELNKSMSFAGQIKYQESIKIYRWEGMLKEKVETLISLLLTLKPKDVKLILN